MATVAPSGLDRSARERRFYTRMALFLAALVFVGFAPSFYLRGIVPSPRPNPTLPPLVMLHGLVFTAWMLLLIAQTQLVAAGRRDLHMKLGGAGMLLGLAMIPLMYAIAVGEVARANQPPFTDPLGWTIVPLSVIPVFALLLWIGWSRRRDPQWHKRAMLGAAILMMGPATGRLPIGPPILPVFAVQMGLAIACFVPLMIWDRRTLGELHPVTKLGFGLATAAVLLDVVTLATGSWAPIAAYLPGV